MTLTLPLELLEEVIACTSIDILYQLEKYFSESSYRYIFRQLLKYRGIAETVRTAFKVPRHMILSGYRVRKSFPQLESTNTEDLPGKVCWELRYQRPGSTAFPYDLRNYVNTFLQKDLICPTFTTIYSRPHRHCDGADIFVLPRSNSNDIFAGFFCLRKLYNQSSGDRHWWIDCVEKDFSVTWSKVHQKTRHVQWYGCAFQFIVVPWHQS